MDQLKKLYYDPENGFIGMQKLYKLSKEHNLNLTFKVSKSRIGIMIKIYYVGGE